MISNRVTADFDLNSATFVGRASCLECHQTEAESFHGSHHNLAMDLATVATVRGKFDGRTLTHFGVTSTFFVRDGKYFVTTDGPLGELQDFEVKYVFGYEPLQQYMVELERGPDYGLQEMGRVQVLRLCWDTVGERWFYLSPPDVNYRLEPDDPLHWTGITMCWNVSCADCHSTNFHKNFDLLTKTYRSRYSEIDVSCEACHGPGSLHVDVMNNRNWYSRTTSTGLVSLKHSDATTQIEVCAKCHSRRRQIADGYHLPQRFADHYSCELLLDHTYHADGQIKDEVYEYGSFTQSRMYHQGIRCTDCHDPHSARLKRPGNSLCTDCHAHPASKYDTPNHHHHPIGSPGALCVECHMPATIYMEVDARRDHSLRVPRPDLSVKFGTPNACSACHIELENLPIEDRAHLKQYADWLAHAKTGNIAIQAELQRLDRAMLEAVKLWYDREYDGSHYYDRLAATSRFSLDFQGSDDRTSAENLLVQLARDASAPDIVRGTAIHRLRQSNSQDSLDTALSLTQSSSSHIVVGAVPRIEAELLKRLDYLQYQPNERVHIDQIKTVVAELINALNHPRLEERLAIFQALLQVPTQFRVQNLDSSQRQRYERVQEEFLLSLKRDADVPQSHVMLANIQATAGNLDDAVRSIRRAIHIAPATQGLRSELANLLSYQVTAMHQAAAQLRQSNDAVRIEELSRAGQELLDEINQLREADHKLLLRDLKRSEGIEGVDALHYRVAMSSYLRGELEATRSHLSQALAAQPQNETYVLAAATFYKSQLEWKEAMEFAKLLVELDPNHPGYRLLFEEISRQLRQ